MKFLDWLVDESPWLLRLPVRIVLGCVLAVLFVVGKMVLTESQWNKCDKYIGEL